MSTFQPAPSGEQLAQIRESIDEAVCSFDRDWRLTYLNPKAEQLLERPREAVIGRTFEDVLPQAVGTVFDRELHRAMADRVAVAFETQRLLLPEWADVRAFPSVVGLTIHIRDITERRRLEEALRQREEDLRRSEESLAHAQQLTHLGNWDRDMRTGRLWWSDEIYRILGVASGNLGEPSEAFLSLVHPEDRDRVKQALDAAMSDEQPYSMDFQIVRPDGVVRVVHSESDMQRDPAGHPLRLVGTVQDITEHKQLEDERDRLLAREQAARAEAQAERAWLQAALDQMPEAVLLFDTCGRIRLFNQVALALSVGETGQVDPFGNPIIHDMRLPSGQPLPVTDIPGIRTVERGELVRNFEMALRQRDGRLVAMRGSSAPICGPNAERLGTVTVVQDVSALKALEQEREEWISIVTHDLRQPVTIILGYAERLARTLPRDGALEQRKSVDFVVMAARNLNRMIGDLLDVSRIDTRRLKLSCECVDLPILVRAIVERASPLTGGHPIRVAIDGEIPPIDLDPSRIEQVLDNLLSNATKYGDPGTEIVVGVQRREGPVGVSVTNHGRGIAPECLARLFTRFYRTYEAEAGAVGGLGLGLYIAKGLVEAHGGQIRAESIPDETTTFTFTLPV